VADRFEAKFHYAIWFEAGRRPASNQMATSHAVHSHQSCSDGMVPSAAAWRYLQRARYNAFSVGRKFVPRDLDLWPLTLAFKLVRARDQTQIRSAVPEIFHTETNKQKVMDNAKNTTLCSCIRLQWQWLLPVCLVVHWLKNCMMLIIFVVAAVIFNWNICITHTVQDCSCRWVADALGDYLLRKP